MPDSAAAAAAAALASASRRWMHFSLEWDFSPQSHLTWDDRFLRSARQCGHWVMGRPFLGTKKSSRSGMSMRKGTLYTDIGMQPLTGMGAAADTVTL